MKSFLLKAGLLTALLFGLSDEETYAASELASKCSSYGEIKKNDNPSFQHRNCLLTNAALKADIPPEVVKAVANQESEGWLQFKNGKPVVSNDGGIGIMQITTKPKGFEDEKRLKYDIIYNIEAGVSVLSSKFNFVNVHGQKIPKIKGAGRKEIENWYFPIMAYNGAKAVNGPVFQSGKNRGLINKDAYQEEVFARIKADSMWGDDHLSKFPFKVEHFSYDKDYNIKFAKTEYTLNKPLHTSNYLLKKGEQVVVTYNGVNLRDQPSKSGLSKKALQKNAQLEVTGKFIFEKDKKSNNQYVWLPVRTLDGKSKGYVASVYVKKFVDKTAPKTPTVNAVSDKSSAVTGKAETNATVYAKVGTKQIGKATAKNGAFSIKISKQKAGTSISVYAVDAAGNKSADKKVKVLDKTAPAAPAVNKITSKTLSVTGKGEKGTTIIIYNGSKKIGQGTIDSQGAFKVKIPAQKKGSTLKLFAKDKSGNQSVSKSVKVS